MPTGGRFELRPVRPDPNVPFYFTAIILMEPRGKGRHYTVIALHADEEGRV